MNYSVLRATTGSFFAAERAGISPEITVNRILTNIITPACHIGSAAIGVTPVKASTIIFKISDKISN